MKNTPRTHDAPPNADSNRTKFAELVAEQNEKLVKFLAARLGSEQEARDVAQEAYAKVLGLGEEKVVNFHRAYLYRTATNIAIDRMRSEKRRAQVSTNMADDYNNLASDAPNAERILVSREKLKALRAAIESLPPKCRYAFLEYRINCRSYAEIANDLSVSESMVRKYVLRALRHCNKCLHDEDQ